MDLILLFIAVTAIMIAVGSVAYSKGYAGVTTLIMVVWSGFTMTVAGTFILALVL